MSAAESERVRASHRRVVVPDETTPEGTAKLMEALARTARTPESVALDHLLSDAAEGGA